MRERRSRYLRTLVAVAICGTFALLILLHTPYLNGPEYWQWEWRRVEAVRWYGLMALGAVPVVGALVMHARRPGRGVGPILLLMLGVVTLKLASVAAVRPPAGMSLIADIVKSRLSTSYYTDAGALSTRFPGWLAEYHEFLYFTGLHTQSKPPGPLLYWTAWIRAMGYNDRTAIAGGIALAGLAACALLATWWLVRTLTDNRDAAFISAATLALCPGFILFFPMLDPAYILLSCGLIGLWHLAVKRDSYLAAIGFGAVLMLTTMTSYALLSLGLFLLFIGLFASDRRASDALLITIRQGMIALLVLVIGYVVLWTLTGFNPIATFATAWENQHLFLARHEAERQYPRTIPFDLLDFALGAAWLPVIAAIVYVVRAVRNDHPRAMHLPLVILCLAQPVAVALSGMVQSETARVWNFMLPLLLLPAGLELAGWSRRERATFYACIWLLLAVVGQNMTFLNPGTDPEPATAPRTQPIARARA